MRATSTVASNVVWTGLGNGVMLVVGLSSSILLARWLGPEGRGLYALILATSMTLAAVLGNNAWTQALAFLAGKNRFLPRQIAGHSMIIVGVCTTLLVVSLIVLPDRFLESLIPELREAHLWLVVILTCATLLFSMLTGLLLGLNQVPLFTSLSVVRAVVALVLQVLLLGVLGLGLQGAMWELVVSGLFAVCMTLVVFVWKAGVDLKVRTGFFRNVLGYGARSYPGHLGVVLLSRIDIYFVALFGGAAAAGIYAVAKGLTEIAAIVEQSISQGITPRVIAGEHVAAAAIVARAFRISLWINVLGLLAGAVAVSWLIPLVYGDEYAAAVPAFLLLLPGVLMLTTRTLGTYFSMQIGRPEIPTYYILAAGLLSLPVSFLLTREYGYLGAASAFSIVAFIRGIAAIVLFMLFSKISLTDLLFISRAELSWIRQAVLPRLKGYMPKEQRV